MPFHVTYIAGAKFRPGAGEILGALETGADLALQPDPKNAHDPNAVKVLHGDRHIGFIPRDLAPEVGKLIAAGRLARVVKASGSTIEVHYTEGDAP